MSSHADDDNFYHVLLHVTSRDCSKKQMRWMPYPKIRRHAVLVLLSGLAANETRIYFEKNR